MHFQTDYIVVLVVAIGFITLILYAMKNSRDNERKEMDEKNKKGDK